MFPSPSAVYEEEFDRVEQAGGGPKEGPDDRDSRSLVVSDGSIGDVSFSLDAPKEMTDTVWCADHLAHIDNLAEMCRQECESAYRRLMLQCRSYIRGLLIPVPLLEKFPNDSPVGENASGDGGAVPSVGDVSFEQYRGAESGSAPGGGEKKEDVGGGESSVDADDDEGWKDAYLAGIFPPAITKKFTNAGIWKLGALVDYLNSGRTFAGIKGIGPSKQGKIEDYLAAYWQQWTYRERHHV